MNYDSKEEKAFHERHPQLERITQDSKQSFKDDEGTTFNAYPDFHDKKNNLLIEFKCHRLNSIPTKKESIKRLDYVQRKHGKVSSYSQLINNWNHSAFKQSAMQKRYRELYQKDKTQPCMVVVFKDGTKISAQQEYLLSNLDVFWLRESDYF